MKNFQIVVHNPFGLIVSRPMTADEVMHIRSGIGEESISRIVLETREAKTVIIPRGMVGRCIFTFEEIK